MSPVAWYYMLALLGQGKLGKLRVDIYQPHFMCNGRAEIASFRLGWILPFFVLICAADAQLFGQVFIIAKIWFVRHQINPLSFVAKGRFLGPPSSSKWTWQGTTNCLFKILRGLSPFVPQESLIKIGSHSVDKYWSRKFCNHISTLAFRNTKLTDVTFVNEYGFSRCQLAVGYL